MELYLRGAVKSDMDLLFAWANDEEVRKNAFHTEQIPYETHVNWFEQVLSDASVHQYILCEGDTPVGQVRLNVEGDTAVIDYSVAPNMRGRGLGSRMLLLVMEKARAELPQVTRFVGQVKRENAASARVFEKCGYRRSDREDYIQYENSDCDDKTVEY